MLVYSETSFAFIRKCEKYLKDIIKTETSVQLRRNRFVLKQYLYPIHIVVFEGKNTLGYFDHLNYQIGLSKALMYSVKEKVLKDILRHEFAHYLCFIQHGIEVKPHGQEFLSICKQYQWPSHVSHASANLENLNQIEGDLAAENLISKVKKLLKLAQSENEYESQAATIKANQLILKYNLNLLKAEKFETLYVEKLMIQKRRSAKLMATYDILKHFMVRPILNYAKGQVTLEVTGSKANIELSSYIAKFLDHELERLWKIHQSKNLLKGQKAKNSFFLGLAKGYDLKVNHMIEDFTENLSKDLVLLNTKLDESVEKIYRRLSKASSSGSIDPSSYNAGKKAGKNLTINQGIKNETSVKFLGKN